MGWLRVIIPAYFLVLTFVLSSPAAPLLMTWLTRLARAVLWGLLIAGLLLGMAWACLHFWIVPRISEFRPALESLARQSLGVPVRIGVLSARSTGWMPLTKRLMRQFGPMMFRAICKAITRFTLRSTRLQVRGVD